VTTFRSRGDWSKHESGVHEAQLKSRLETKRCPLCLTSVVSTKQLFRHVGRHLRELSLASLPTLEGPDDDERPRENAVSIVSNIVLHLKEP
jgi:hypothetical protein